MGMGMEGGMGAQYSWLHSIQHFTSSLGYLTEVCVCCLLARAALSRYTSVTSFIGE
jgi:hypothetical protein